MTTMERPDVDPICTPYEAWCERERIHPEAPGAYEYYAWTLEQPTP